MKPLRESVAWLVGSDGTRSSWRSGLLLLIAVAVLIVVREPGLLIHPRLWAEEGSLYLATSLTLPWWKALLAVHKGYFSLLPNLATLLAARVFPLAWAPWVTTLFAFLLQLVPVAIVGFSPSKFWPTNLQRMLVVVALLFSWNSGEVWLNTINAQFWWLSICFLILLTDQQMTSRRRHRLFCVALFLCGLNGVVSAFLLPLFIARAIVERNPRIVKQTLALGAASLLQFVAVWLAFAAGAATGRLGGGQSQRFLEFVLVRGVLRGFVAPETAWGLMPHRYWVTCGLGLAAVFLATRVGWRGLAYLVGGFLLTAVLSLVFSMQQTPAPRYFFVPSVMLLVLLIANIDWPMPHPSLLQAVRSLLAAAALVLFFRQTVPQYRAAMADFTNPAWPRWSGEVQKWENDQRYQPKIPPCWDGNCWKVDLAATHRPR
jgi:hypothetical protein